MRVQFPVTRLSKVSISTQVWGLGMRPLEFQFGWYSVCVTYCRVDRVKEVDVLCYRDYTREGRRVTTHSLLLQGVKLPPKSSSQGEQNSWGACTAGTNDQNQ